MLANEVKGAKDSEEIVLKGSARHLSDRNESMIKESSDYKITVKALCRREIDSQLDKAVEGAITQALKCRSQGLVITRHDYTTFTVELRDSVPFGITIERDQLLRPRA